MITAMTRITMMTIIANISLRTVLTMKMSCKTDGDGDLSNLLRHRVILVPDVKLKNIGSVAHLVFAIRRRVVGLREQAATSILNFSFHTGLRSLSITEVFAILAFPSRTSTKGSVTS